MTAMVRLIALGRHVRNGEPALPAVLVLAIALGLVLAPTVGAAQQTTALAVQVASPARAVYGSDGREHIDYDLVITNAFTAPVRLESIAVRGGGRRLLTLRGKAVAAHTFALFGATPTQTIPASSAVKILVDVVLPRSFGRAWPTRLTHQIGYTVSAKAPVRAAIGSTVVNGPTVTISQRAPIRIAPPVRGSGWIAVNACCGDPTAPHRMTLLPTAGSYRTPEIFAIDWIREVNGAYFTGNGTTLTDYPYYGTPIHAVANGLVVQAINDRLEVPPNTTTAKNTTLHTPGDFAGNSVVEQIAPGQYASYAHMQTGSVRVKVGQRLRTGQVIGLLGNSGNTTAPHLHFGMINGPDFLTSDSLPFAFGSYTVQGVANQGAKPGSIDIVGTPRQSTLSEPLVDAVVNFTH